MAHHVTFTHFALTDTGRVREHNEDALAVIEECGVAILADGMGGYRAGEVASRIAVDACSEVVRHVLPQLADLSGAALQENLAQLMRKAVTSANAAIIEAARVTPDYAGMGTTVVLTLLDADRIWFAHVGDSRLYRLRAGVLQQLTRDHSLVQEQIDAGLLSIDAARAAPNRHLVTRALGIEATVAVDLGQATSMAGDVYLLCSDGLTDMVCDEEIAELLQGTDSSLPLQQAARDLVARANALGGVDNISVILLRVEAHDPAVPGLLARVRRLLG